MERTGGKSFSCFYNVKATQLLARKSGWLEREQTSSLVDVQN